MKIDLMDSITLDNDMTYTVVGKVNYKEINYYLLVNEDNDIPFDMIIAYLDGEELVSVRDGEKYLKIFELFNIDDYL